MQNTTKHARMESTVTYVAPHCSDASDGGEVSRVNSLSSIVPVDRGGVLFLAKARAISHRFEDYEAYRDESVSPLELLMWAIFGMSGWWSCNAIFSELPFFVETLPDAERIGNQLGVVTQLGNVFLILYKLLELRFRLKANLVIPLMMTSAALALVGCATFWNVSFGGHNFVLLLMMTVAGGVGCMSNAVYWAFMIPFPPICTKAVGFGMSMGGILTTSMAAFQLCGRSRGQPRFGASVFFLIAAVLQVLWLGVTRRQLQTGDPKMPSLYGVNPDPLTATLSTNGISRRPSSTSVEIYILTTVSFTIHAATYTLPTLLPFVAMSYKGAGIEQELLVWMLSCQQVGEALGRLAAPSRTYKTAFAVLAGFCMTIIFLILFASAVQPSLLAMILPAEFAVYVVPAFCLGYYFFYGVMQTVIFLRARRSVPCKDDAEALASTMGFLGQMGALSANVVAALFVNT